MDLGHLGGYQHPTVNPQGQAFVPHSDGVPTELPGFGDRKSSMGSTNEREASSSPDTPYMSAASQVDQQVTIVRADHSPHVHYDYRTPSPQSGLHQYEQSLMLHSLAMHGHSLSKDSVSSFGPIIPPAITAVYESRVSRKSLEASLYNANRTTNVYIRGFPPETDDAMLLSYAANFGRVLTSKAMIDNQTGACKGFGFACFQTFQEAENCIRGFYGLGYDVSFARESFNARLKALSDPLSTNLYVSNLPRSMTEAELAAIFMGYTVESSRIQRDEHGNSKGVGFARFKTRKECDEVIEKFNGQLLGQERMPFQVRYADTQEQKRFKQVTQERRDFKSGEYNHVAYGPAPPSYYQLQHARAGSYSAMSRLPFGRRSNAHWAGYRHRNNVERARYALERIPKLELTSTRDALCDQK
ncbi:MAG: hypothetical protein M1832_005292 [Thelocarpon impressellum]|nr:MAG: hypothetical protein M1832_005292 [Thelocarpon impressellum]